MGWDYGCKCRHYEVLPIHRFGHQSGRGERSGGLSTAKFPVFSARVFLDMSQEAHIRNIIEFLGQTGAWVGLGGNGDGNGAGDGGILIYTNPN